eukprot:7385476-Prymnesium_polylepis.1
MRSLSTNERTSEPWPTPRAQMSTRVASPSACSRLTVHARGTTAVGRERRAGSMSSGAACAGKRESKKETCERKKRSGPVREEAGWVTAHPSRESAAAAHPALAGCREAGAPRAWPAPS